VGQVSSTGLPRYKVNALFMVPTMIKMVIDHPKARDADFSSLKWVVYGGGADVRPTT